MGLAEALKCTLEGVPTTTLEWKVQLLKLAAVTFKFNSTAQ
jgi:hypothetical protein